jgi:hypothetical protein
MICVVENSNKFQKTKFWKEKSVQDMITFGPIAKATLVLTMSNTSWVLVANYVGSAFLLLCLASSKTN